MIDADYRDRSFAGKEQERLHFHASYEILFVTEGWVDVLVADESLHAQAPALVFLGNLEKHQITDFSEDYERYVLMVTPDHLRDLSPMLLSIFCYRPQGFSNIVTIAAAQKELLRTTFDMLRLESKKESAYSQLLMESLIRILIVQVYRISPNSFPGVKAKYLEEITQAKNYFDDHFCEVISIGDVASRFFMSAHYFRHIFTDLVGVSPKQYIMLNRLVWSREKLEHSSLNIQSIALQCGFADASNFSRRFREYYGFSPREVRKTKLEGVD